MMLGSMAEFKPRFRFRHKNFEYRIEATLRNFDVSSGELYQEQFYTLGVTYRKNKIISHRLLLLHDITKRNLDLWVIEEPAEEEESSFEYTLIYTPDNVWSVLSGIKYGSEGDSDVDDRTLTDREVFVKIERKFDVLF